MKCNVGKTDRIIRIVLGVIFLVAGIVAPVGMTWRVVLLVIAAVALVTAIIRFCPANAILGIDTCESEEKK